jgi:MFS family permease
MRKDTMTGRSAHGGLLIFGLIWLGQLVSLIGSGLTEFGIGVWVYQRSESATEFALIAFFTTLPHVLVSPLAGALVDRWDRRWVMIGSDCGAALSSLSVALLAWSGRLEVWQVYLAVLFTSSCIAFQFPAYISLMTHLVPKQHLGRANGLLGLAWSAPLIAAPLLAAALLEQVGLAGLILVDMVTFLVGVSTLLMVRVTGPATVTKPAATKDALLCEVVVGWRYIAARPGLRQLLLVFVPVNFSVGLTNVLFAPLVLSFTSPAVLGSIVAIAGGGGYLVGSLLMTVWGGPKRRVLGILGPGPLLGLGLLALGLGPSAALIAAAGFLYFVCQPIINSCDQALWQSKVALEVQGRVFATRRSLEHAAVLLAYLVAGPLADRVFGPLLMPTGPLAGSVGLILGVGPGRGIGLLLVLLGLVTLLALAWGVLSPRVRRIDRELPDIEQELPTTVGEVASPSQSGGSRRAAEPTVAAAAAA